MTRIVVLDNEAVQALASPHHPKHQRVLGYVELVERRKRHAAPISVLAAAIREQAQVSVADAHIGATVQSAPDVDITVVTSDPEDISAVCGDRQVTVVAI